MLALCFHLFYCFMSGLAKLAWVISLLLFLGVLLYTYVYLPERIDFGSTAESLPLVTLLKAEYFYGIVGAVAVANVLIILLGNLFKYLPTPFLPVPQRLFWMRDSLTRKHLYEHLEGWTRGLGFCINLFFTLLTVEVYNQYEPFAKIPTAFWYFACVVILLAWLGFYWFWFSAMAKEEHLVHK